MLHVQRGTSQSAYFHKPLRYEEECFSADEFADSSLPLLDAEFSPYQDPHSHRQTRDVEKRVLCPLLSRFQKQVYAKNCAFFSTCRNQHPTSPDSSPLMHVRYKLRSAVPTTDGSLLHRDQPLHSEAPTHTSNVLSYRRDEVVYIFTRSCILSLHYWTVEYWWAHDGPVGLRSVREFSYYLRTHWYPLCFELALQLWRGLPKIRLELPCSKRDVKQSTHLRQLCPHLLHNL